MPTKVIDLGKPNPKQDLFLRDTHRHCAYGGARGGGKSWVLDRKLILLCFRYPRYRALLLRRTYREVIQNHVEPMMQLLAGVCKYNKSDNVIVFPNGSRIILGYVNTENDVLQYQGNEYDCIAFDEATQIREEWIKKICASCRGINDYPKRIYYTCNPSGVSHGYIKRLFIDRKYEAYENPEDYNFIQALVTDNPVLMETNPDYVRFLESLPPVLKEAWMNGRWDVFEGSYFSEMRETPDPRMCEEHGVTIADAEREHLWTHVIKPFEIPKDWKIYAGYDWGYGKPFCMSWYAIDYDGCAYNILELYGCTNQPNEGLRWSNEEQFKEIASIERNHRWLKGKQISRVADPSIWDGSRGISAAETADKYGVYFDKGINDRVAGWMQVRERLKFDENGKPMLYFFENCKNIIRTIPLMMFDEHHVEDLDTDLEDHACDALRYFCMSRPIAPRLIKSEYKPDYDPLDMFK